MGVAREALQVLPRQRLGLPEVLFLTQGFDLEQQGFAIENTHDPRTLVAIELSQRAVGVPGFERLARRIDLSHFTREHPCLLWLRVSSCWRRLRAVGA